MARVQLFGDPDKAAIWIGWARKKLEVARNLAVFSALPSYRNMYKVNSEVLVEISWFPFGESIKIWAEKKGAFVIICHVGDDTGINGYNKKFYRLEGTKLIELSATLTGRTFSVEGLSLLDDGKYFLNYDLTTYDDPDNYDYNFNPTGLIAEDGSGTAIKKMVGEDGRFILNQSFEEEFFRAYVTDVDGTDRSYLVLDDSLTFRPYKIKGNPVFNRYTDDSVIYLHSRTKHDPSSLVLRNDTYGAGGVSDGFGDNLFIINKLYKKNLSDESKTEKTINADANGAALYGATKFYSNKQEVQNIGRVKTLDFFGFPFAEPAVREEYGAGTEEETFNRCADGGDTCFFMKGRTISGSQFDPQGHMLDPGFDTIRGDVKLPYTFTGDGKQTYVRMQKNLDFTTLNTGLYVADQLIEESGVEDVLILADGVGGTQDSATGKWVMEQNGPIVVRKTVYTILHAHHDDFFDAVLYKKTTYKSHSEDLLPYRKARLLGSQADNVNGQIKRTLVESDSEYFIVVNGAITSLNYIYRAREYTLTAKSVEGSGTNISNWIDLPWTDIGYDKDGNSLSETNRQITRIFTTAMTNSLLFSFDVWNTVSKHDLIFDDSNEEYKYLWADYDTGITAYPPLVDLENIEERKWILFDAAGVGKEIDTPKDNDIDFKRVNGLLMVGI